jgi:hypothetical protein
MIPASFTSELTHVSWLDNTSGLSTFGAAIVENLFVFRKPKEYDFLILLSSSPRMDQSNFPSGEPQPEKFEGSELKLVVLLRSIKL